MSARFCLLALVTLFIPAAAHAAPGVVREVRFESHPDRLDFYFTADAPIDGSLAEAIPARRGEVLILRLGGVSVDRRWVEFQDPAIARALLHPSKERPPGAILRVRFINRGMITAKLVKGIKAEYVSDERTVLISVPRPPGAPRPDPPAESDAPMVMAPAVIGDGDGDGDGEDPPATPDPASVPDPTPAPPTAANPPSEPPPPAEPTPELPPAPPVQVPVSADVPAGVDGLIERLQLGLAPRPGIPRVALLPFTVLDDPSREAHLGETTTALVGARLVRRPGLVVVDHDLLTSRLDALHRDADDRYGLDEARAVAAMLGADTVIAGSVGLGPGGVVITGRALDAETGRDLSTAEQAFVTSALISTRDAVRHERTVGGTVLRSMVAPGWGQLYQGDVGRGAGYLTGFVAVLGAGLVSTALGALAEDDYTRDDASTVGRRADADDHYARATALYIGAGAIWLASVVDAIATGEHRVEYIVPTETP